MVEFYSIFTACHPTETKNERMFTQTIDKNKQVFYTCYCQQNKKDLSNHTNGVAAPLTRQVFTHMNKFNAKTARI